MALVAAIASSCSRETLTRVSTSATPVASHTTDAPQNLERLAIPREEARAALCELYAKLDVDCDKRLTVLDQRAQCAQPPCALDLKVKLGSETVALTQLHQASQLATNLAEGLKHDTDASSPIPIEFEQVFQNPVDYLAERIERRYWSGLTRTISTSEAELQRALVDDKQDAPRREEDSWCREQTPQCTQPTSQPPPSSASPARATHYLYVPEDDPTAFHTYAPLQRTMPLEVERLPPSFSAEWVSSLTRNDKHGLLALAHDNHGNALPFVVPGGRFNEMYGWDSYFIAWGLLQSDKLSLARAMAEHQAYEIIHYGKVLNANRTYYLTRSQPPFFPALVRKVVDAIAFLANTAEESVMPQFDGNPVWVERMLQAAEREYANVWAAPPRRTTLCEGNVCLTRYYGDGVGQPPEVEAGHFAAFYQAHAIRHRHCAPPVSTEAAQRAFLACVQELERSYTDGTLSDPAIDAFFVNDRCVRESGHDTTFRWFGEGQERCASYVTVDLNTLLLQYELDVAHLYLEGAPERRSRAEVWCERARHRAALMRRHLWNERNGAYFDYDVENKRQSTYLAATTLYPLWVNSNNECKVTLVSPEQAQKLVRTALPRLEAPGGLLAASPESQAKVAKPSVLSALGNRIEEQSPPRQWEAPNGWAPHQMLAWVGLQQHGFNEDAQRLAYRWLLLIAENAANFHGTVPEKFDVMARSHRVFAEYGNVGTEFSYIAPEGFGWMNASFIVGLDVLTPEQHAFLTALKPTESVF